MNPEIRTLHDYCAQVLQGDEGAVHRLRAAGFVCEAGFWVFGLPALHRFLCSEGHDGYRGWVQQLYASDFNTRLRELGGEIAIHENRGKVDASCYCLRRVPAQAG